jgi:hypothetical protein
VGLAGVRGVQQARGGAGAKDGMAEPPASADGESEGGGLPRTEWIVRILCVIFVTSAFYVFYYEDNLFQLRRRFALLKELRLDRFYFLFPMLWHLAADFAAVRIWRDRSLVRFVAPLLLVTQLGYLVTRAEWFDRDGYGRGSAPMGFQEDLPLAGHARYLDPGARPTYREFVAKELFDEAERLIGRPRTELDVACLGIYPSQANLNDFRTVEGYWYLYPLEAKHRWRKVVQGELDRSTWLRDWFRGWGSMAYLFSSELGTNFLIEKRRNLRSIEELRIDTRALAELGTDYIFSAVEIGNAEAIGLKLLGRLEHDEAAMDMYVYEVPVYEDAAGERIGGGGEEGEGN